MQIRLTVPSVHEYAYTDGSPSKLFNDPLVRRRAVNNLVYWISQIIGSVVIGLLLDSPKVKRRARAFLGVYLSLWCSLSTYGLISTNGGSWEDQNYTR